MNTTEKDDNADLIGSMAGPSALSTLASLWSGTYEERRTLPIYHMYIKEVNNDELKKQDDVIEHPAHYTQGIECMDYIESHK